MIGVFAIIGVALYSIAKASIAKGIEKEAEKEGKRYSGLEARIDQMRAASLRYHPTEYTLQLEEGIKSAGKCCYSKNSDDLVVVSLSVKAAEGELKPRIHKIATLPEGFRPDKVISQTVSETMTIRIYENGTIAYDGISKVKELSCASIIFYASPT